MRVTGIERIIVDVPFTPRQQRITEREVHNWSILELCKVSTDTGHVGWGETVIHYTWSRVTDDAVAKVTGQSPAKMMNDDSLGAGLQMALFDVVGKILEVPVHTLLGKRIREQVPISWWSIDASPEDWAAEAKDAVGNGYTSFKLKPRPWQDIVKQVDAINAVVPSGFKLDLDPNSTLQNAENAIPVIHKLEEYDIVAIFESPIPQDDIPGNQQIRQEINSQVAMHFGSPPYLVGVREEVCDGYVICAGKSEAMRQGFLSEEADKPFWLQLVGNGLTTTWAAHLGAVLTNATWPAITCINLYSNQLLTGEIKVVDGHHAVPDEPGLGVTVDLESVDRYRVPAHKLEPFLTKGELYEHPQPRIISTIVYPDGSCIHMGSSSQGYEYFTSGQGPAYVEGVYLDPWYDDGTIEWNDLFERALKEPVRSQYQPR
ncbi:TPA: enolase [Candidatus Poribacteria bacterium]|nr:enolase [Candidatus Poribacteria bacterium]HIB98389.1 enolase [Candidatus Poribacteria bacterium]HIO07314.1 enolase [Candidatus Poribacteria bacterium]HIO77445.1 enolase [Candidatus Poribacteria bacterium]